MMSPAMYPTGRVPDFRFAAFEVGVIKTIRHTWDAMKKKKGA